VLGAQLKIYPLVFGIFFILDWNKWRENILRFFIYGVAFLTGFFVLGYSVFSEYLHTLTLYIKTPMSWIGNHSVYSYLFAIKEIQDPTASVLYWLYIYLFMVCFLLIVYSAYRRKSILDPGLLLICTIVACILPSTSHDYKLPLFYTACMYYFAMMERNYENKKLGILDILAFGCIGLSAIALMYPYQYREHIGDLGSAFPFFVWVSIAVTVHSVKPIISAYLDKQRAFLPQGE
jgi:hypothetical protein